MQYIVLLTVGEMCVGYGSTNFVVIRWCVVQARRIFRVKLTDARQRRGNPSLPFISSQSFTPPSTPYMHRYYHVSRMQSQYKISKRYELKLRKIKSIQIVYLSYSSQPRRSMNGHVVNLITTAQPQSMYGSLRV